jgi:hypothetical protein
MKIKEGVKFQPEFIFREAFIKADKIYEKHGQELVITRGREWAENSSPGSLHPYGLAHDFRTKYFDELTQQKVYLDLRDELGTQFTVIKKQTHIHVQLNLNAQPKQ